MKRLLYIIVNAFICSTLWNCQEVPNNESREIKGKSSDYYLKELHNDSTTADSILTNIRTLLTDSMRWWGMDVIHRYTMDKASWLDKQKRQIAQSFEWSKKYPKNNFILGIIWNQKGLYYVNTYKVDSAVHCFRNAYKKLSETKAYEQLSTVVLNLASAYYRSGNTPKAAKYYKRASLLSDSLHSTSNIVSIRIGLAQVYADLHNFILAQQHLDQAKSYFSQANFYEKYFYYFTRGICNFYQKEYSLAYACFNIAIDYAERINHTQYMICQASLGETAMMDKHLDLAMMHIKPCIDFLEENPDLPDKTFKFYICSLSIDVLKANGRTQEAVKISHMLPKDKDVKMLRYLSHHYARMSHYCEMEQDYKNAFKYLRKAHKYKDIINNDNAINNIIEINQRYQQDTTQLKQNMTLANIGVKNSNFRLLLSSIIGGLCLIICLCLSIIIITRRRNDKRYHSHIKQITQLRMDIVRNRISPHFIFNVLGMMLPKFKANPELHQISELFIDVLRGNLVVSNQLSIAFGDEVKLVKQYVSLYHKCTSQYPIVNWHDSTNGEADQIQVPTMCVQIPVENALKHAFSTLNEHCVINIFIFTENRRLILKIIDNGDGYNPGRVTATGRDTGTGLRVLSRTFTLLNSQNGNPIEFHITNLSKENGTGTKVQISIPFDYQFTKYTK